MAQPWHLYSTFSQYLYSFHSGSQSFKLIYLQRRDLQRMSHLTTDSHENFFLVNIMSALVRSITLTVWNSKSRWLLFYLVSVVDCCIPARNLKSKMASWFFSLIIFIKKAIKNKNHTHFTYRKLFVVFKLYLWLHFCISFCISYYYFLYFDFWYIFISCRVSAWDRRSEMASYEYFLGRKINTKVPKIPHILHR